MALDPDISLKEILKIAAQTLNDGEDICSDDLVCMAELIESLDEHLANGGTLPKRWEGRTHGQV